MKNQLGTMAMYLNDYLEFYKAKAEEIGFFALFAVNTNSDAARMEVDDAAESSDPSLQGLTIKDILLRYALEIKASKVAK